MSAGTAPTTPLQAMSAPERQVAEFEAARAHLAAQNVKVRLVDRRAFPPRYLVTLRPGTATRQEVLDLARDCGFAG